ncbi:MAG: ThiF family adenylyltransferase [Streptosporangiaceae bacterium]
MPEVQNDPDALSPELRDRLLYYAYRAPSPHNAQGWRLDNGGRIFRVSRDPAHQVLRDFDPEGRESDLACGAVVTNLCVGARASGFEAEVRWRPADGTAADVTLRPASAPPDDAALARLRTLRRRAMNRSPYRPDPVPGSVIDGLRATAERLGFTLSVLTERAAIGRLAAVAAQGGVMKLMHGPTQAELHALMRFSPQAAARKRDGLDLELFFTPAIAARVAAVATHPRVLSAAAPLHVAEMVVRENDEVPLRSAPALCLLHAGSLDAETFLRGGACFQEIALDVTAAGLAMALHSAPIEVGLSRPGPLSPSVPAEWHAGIADIRRELLAGFGVGPDTVPIAFFRLGTPTREPERKSLRRRPDAPRPETAHYKEMTRRNQPSLSREEQAALRATRILVAGCGSIGGATVVPLVRLGAERFVLCEPDHYELNNLNRQSADLGDIGRNKAEVQAARARAINPDVEMLVETDGVTEDNVDWLVGTTDLVIDGVDVTEPAGIAAKRALHQEAWRQRRLVISGLDLGGTQLVYAFDYRDGRTKPLDGRLDGAPDGIEALDFLSRLVDPLDVPRELLSYTEAMIRGEAGSPPQLAPAADQFGVLAAWIVLDVAAGRPVRKRVKVAIPDLVRPRSRQVASETARMFQLARVKFLLEASKRRAKAQKRAGGGTPGSSGGGS